MLMERISLAESSKDHQVTFIHDKEMKLKDRKKKTIDNSKNAFPLSNVSISLNHVQDHQDLQVCRTFNKSISIHLYLTLTFFFDSRCARWKRRSGTDRSTWSWWREGSSRQAWQARKLPPFVTFFFAHYLFKLTKKKKKTLEKTQRPKVCVSCDALKCPFQMLAHPLKKIHTVSQVDI